MKFFSRSKGAKTPETATPTETSASTAEVSPSASTISIPITSTNLVDMSEGALRERVYDLEREHAQSRADMFVPKPTSDNRVESWADLSSFQREPLQVPSPTNETSPTPMT